MKQKRTIILISIFACIACIMVIFSTVFSLSKIEVFLPQTANFTINEVVSASKLKKGNSIFTLNKKKSIENLEKTFAEGKFNLEIKFPNKIVINVQKRNPLLYTEKNAKFYVFDNDLKLIAVQDTYPGAAIKTELEVNTVLGGFNSSSLYLSLVKCFINYGFDNFKMLENFKFIKVDSSNVATIKTIKNYNFIIEDISDILNDKVSNIVGLYESSNFQPADTETDLLVRKTADGQVLIIKR